MAPKKPSRAYRWYIRNREKTNALRKERHHNNPSHYRKLRRDSYHKNKIKIRARERIRYMKSTLPFIHSRKYTIKSRMLRAELRKAIFEKHGNVCTHCGFSDIRALQIDHIKGMGWKDPRNLAFYRKVLADNSGNFQILCANCNWIKRAMLKEERQPLLNSDNMLTLPKLGQVDDGS